MTSAEIETIVEGAVLAGGKSTRMGRSKAFLPHGETTFLMATVNTLDTLFQHVMIIGDDPALSVCAGRAVLHDVYKGCGPLGGLHTALVHAEKPMVFVCPTDMPLLAEQDIRDLLCAAPTDKITIARAGERWHPLFGVYPARIAVEFENTLSRGALRMRDVIEASSCGYELYPVDTSNTNFLNINTPDEYLGFLRSTKDHGPLET